MTLANKWGLTSNKLKIIAIVSMLIDHFGAVILYHATSYASGAQSLFPYANELYYGCRIIGRIAFPIFAFLIVEGSRHTKDSKKYLFRIFLFALISEVPFDLAIRSKVWDLGLQNVFLTLFFGLAAIICMDKLNVLKGISHEIKVIGDFILSVSAMGLAYYLKTDYGFQGVLVILIFYFLYDENGMYIKKVTACLLAFLTLFGGLESFCFPAFIFIFLYNGKKGKKMKYFFYLFYPLHLIMLYFIWIYLLK